MATHRIINMGAGRYAGAARASAGTALVLAQLPPPHHGQSAMAGTVMDVLRDDLGLQIVHRWRGGATTHGDVGRRTARKYVGFLLLLCTLLGDALRARRYSFAYLGIAPWSHAAIRDCLLTAMAKLTTERVLLHVHGQGLARLIRGPRLRAWVARKLLRGAEVLAVDEETARAAEASRLFACVHRLPNTVPDPGPNLRQADMPLTIGCLANLDPRKGVFDFIDSVAGLIEEGYPVRGVIVGGATAALSLEDVRAAIRARGMTGNIVATGPAADARKAELLRSFDVFLYLSRHDLAPLALIEALAFGIVPIVLDIGGLRQIVGPGLAANVLDPNVDPATRQQAITAIIKSYCAHTDRIEKDRRAARDRFVDHYTPARFSSRLRSVVGERLLLGKDPADRRLKQRTQVAS